MPFLSDADREAVLRQLGPLNGPVKLVNFTQELECQYCKETSQILKEVASLSEKFSTDIYNFISDKEKADQLKVEMIPATIVMGEEDRGIRFYGVPSGYEFVSLLEAIKMVSTGQSGLTERSKEILKSLKEPLRIQVYVTPT